MFIGNKKIVSFLENALADGNLAHAYCFVGPDQVGKRTLARSLAEKLLNTPQEKLAQHPDYHYLEREEDEKTGKKKKNISIAQTREMRSKLSNRSWLSGYQVAIVDEAELLNEESANALLKLLEEPGEKSVFFLITDNESNLLPTIRSRCQQFYFSLVGKDEMKKGLESFGYSEEEIERWIPLAWGRPGRALSFPKDSGLEEEYWQEISRWEKIIGRPFHSKLKAVEDLFSEKEDTVRRKDKLEKVLNIWIMIWREVMLSKAGKEDEETTERIGKETAKTAVEIGRFIGKLEEASGLLNQNVNAHLIFEQLLLNI